VPHDLKWVFKTSYCQLNSSVAIIDSWCSRCWLLGSFKPFFVCVKYLLYIQQQASVHLD